MLRLVIACLLAIAGLSTAERINHAGRILGPAPTVTAPTLFNTAAADSVVAAMQIMPRDNPWNEDISNRPVLANSNAMIAMIRSDVGVANRQRLVVFKEMNYVLVPDNQAKVDIRFTEYPDESDDIKPGTSDIGSYPIPSNMPVETWPSELPGVSNSQWQRDTPGYGGDRHSIVVMPGAGYIWETWQTLLTSGTPAWTASNGCRFDLATNDLRPAGWTSGDAAGLPMFPALVRYDEVQRGAIEHALRIVVKRSRNAYIYPATHRAGSTSDANVPAMGQRLRLKSSFTIPASWTAQERAIAVALKKYGALVADNGAFFSVSICPDDRWPSGCFNHLSTGAGSDYLDINQFEVVQSTGPNEGPRSPGAPTVNAGPDQSIGLAGSATLSGTATGTGITTLWYAYPGAPGTVAFANPNALTTTATFSAAGTYILMLRASNSVHTPAYDAIVVTVDAAGGNPAPTLSAISPSGATPGSASFTMTLTGSGFIADSVVGWSGRADLLPVTRTATEITVTVPAGYVADLGTSTITVRNPPPGGGTSAGHTFVVAQPNPVPGLDAIAPTAAAQHDAAFAMTLTGSDFAPGAVVGWSGQANLTPRVRTATQIVVDVPSAYLATAGTVAVSVINPAPGGGASADRAFSITADTTPPSILSITNSLPGSTRVTILWTTSEPADGRIEFGLEDAYSSSTSLSSDLVTSHALTLTGLSPSTTYHYRIITVDAAGNSQSSGDLTFTTAPAGRMSPRVGTADGGACGFGTAAALLLGCGALLQLQLRPARRRHG